MKAPSAILGLLAAIVLAVPPAASSGQRLVPPGNSAVNQYTETIPAGGGNATAGSRPHRTAKDVIGPRKTRRLEAAGPAGGEVADIVAATAPPTLSSKPAPEKAQPERAPMTPRSAPHGDGSGLDTVIAEATGSSDSGELGLLLPLLIVCAVVGSATYVVVQRRRVS